MIIQKKEVHPSGSNRGSCKGKVIAIKNAPAIHEFQILTKLLTHYLILIFVLDFWASTNSIKQLHPRTHIVAMLPEDTTANEIAINNARFYRQKCRRTPLDRICTWPQ